MISIIAAFAGTKRVIGNKGKLPWHISADLRYFRHHTTGHPVIMGRNTYESIGKPLPERTNIVLSLSMRERSKVFVARSLKEALALARQAPGSEEIFIIGGETVFQSSLALADRLYLTKIDVEIEGDTFFPAYEHLFPHIVAHESLATDGYNLSFVTYERGS